MKCKILKAIILVSIGCLLLGGCGSSVTKMTSDSLALENKHPYSVKVETAGWEKIDKLQTSGLTNERYTQTLIKSIQNTGLFKEAIETGNADYNLKVTVIKHILPGHIGDFDLTMTTQWQLSDKTDKVICTETIDSVYTSKLTDELVTFDRLQKANENLVKINIEQGIKKLAQLKF